MHTVAERMHLSALIRTGWLRRTSWLVCILCLHGVSAGPAEVRTRALGGLLSEPVFSAPASVIARNRPEIAAEIAARIVELPVRVGEHVTAGDILARLDCRSHESRLAVARAELRVTRAQLDHARGQLTRARNLKKNRSISDELLDQRELELATRQAEEGARREAVRQAEIDVGHCDIRAPFDAVVTTRPVSVGTYMARGNAVIGLLETSGQEVSARLRESEIATMQDAENLVFEAVTGRFPLQLRALLPVTDANTRTREARLEFTDETAIAGTAGRLVWRGRQLTLPADYLVRRQDMLGIFITRGDTAHFIHLPRAQEGQAAVVDLPAQTLLITEGRWRLVDGQQISVVPPPQ